MLISPTRTHSKKHCRCLHREHYSERITQIRSIRSAKRPMQLKEDVPSSKTFHTSERKSTVSASDLSERWFIGLKQATQTIKSTSQRLLRSTILPLARRYRADKIYEHPRLRGVVYTDTMHVHLKSLDGNK